MEIGNLPLVPYYQLSDEGFYDAVRGLPGKHTAVLLANHGPVVSGKKLDAAVYAMEELEETAKLYLLIQSHNPRCLTPDQIVKLEQVFGKAEG